MIAVKNWTKLRDVYSGSNSSIPILTQISAGLNPGFRGEKPTANRRVLAGPVSEPVGIVEQ
jgi:hypothetical protein